MFVTYNPLYYIYVRYTINEKNNLCLIQCIYWDFLHAQSVHYLSSCSFGRNHSRVYAIGSIISNNLDYILLWTFLRSASTFNLFDQDKTLEFNWSWCFYNWFNGYVMPVHSFGSFYISFNNQKIAHNSHNKCLNNAYESSV